MSSFFTKKNRAYIYTLAGVIVPVMIAYNIIEPEQAPMWLAVVAAVLGLAAPVTALSHMTPDDKDLTTMFELDIEGE